MLIRPSTMDTICGSIITVCCITHSRISEFSVTKAPDTLLVVMTTTKYVIIIAIDKENNVCMEAFSEGGKKYVC